MLVNTGPSAPLQRSGKRLFSQSNTGGSSMALVRLLAVNSVDGLPTQVATTDTTEFGGLALTGNLVLSNAAKITGVAAANANGDALTYGQGDAVLDGLDLNGGELTNLANGTAPTSAATVAQLNAMTQGIKPKEIARVATTANITLTGFQTIDGVMVADGDRVLVKNQTNGVQNGIYIARTGAWERAADLPAGEHAGGAHVFIQEGTDNTARAYYQSVTGPDDIAGTHALVWVRHFSVTPQTLDGAGLYRTGQELNVGAGAGIDAQAEAIAVALSATDPGLEFDDVGDDGALRIKAGHGIERTAGGTAVKLDGATLARGADGLKVLGLPSLFTVNGTAVGASVSAGNLDTLTNGGNADALHYHTMGASTEAPKVRFPVGNAGEALAKGDAIYFSANNVPSRATALFADGKFRAVALADAAVANGAAAHGQTAGVLEGALTGATAGTAYFVGRTGGLVLYTALASGDRIIRAGFAKNATDLVVAIQDIGQLM